MYGREIISTSNSANKRSQDQKKSVAHKNVPVKTNTISVIITVLHRWNTLSNIVHSVWSPFIGHVHYYPTSYRQTSIHENKWSVFHA